MRRYTVNHRAVSYVTLVDLRIQTFSILSLRLIRVTGSDHTASALLAGVPGSRLITGRHGQLFGAKLWVRGV